MKGKSKRVCVVFPGQGSQEKNMGRDVAEEFSDVMDLWKYAEKITKTELREIYWEGDENEMKRTRYLQPAMTVVGLGYWYALNKKGIEVDGFAGHSLGEFTALGAAKVLSTHELLDLVSLRGKLMDEVDSEGSMAAVLKLGEEEVKKMVEDVKRNFPDKVLCVANYNSPSQFVVSGHKEVVDELSVKVKSLKGRAIALAVSGAFHSELMMEASKELAKFMDKLSWKDALKPIYFNVTGEPVIKAQNIVKIMKKQMISPVLWIKVISNQYRDGFRSWLECGPKGVLTRLIKQILNRKDDINIACVDSLEKVEKFS